MTTFRDRDILRKTQRESEEFIETGTWGQVEGLDQENARRVLRTFLDLCYRSYAADLSTLEASDLEKLLLVDMPKVLKADKPYTKLGPDLVGKFLAYRHEQEKLAQFDELNAVVQKAQQELPEILEGKKKAPKIEAKQPLTRTQPKVGRNDPCPCGSGKKFKACHMNA